MLELQKYKNNFERFLIVLVIMCIIAYLIVYATMNIFGFTLFCDSDMYLDTLIAKLMWEQKTLFPDGWVFGNQFYVIATPVLAALLYGMIGNVNTAMVLATEIMTFFILLSFWKLLRALTKDCLAIAVGCMLLLSSIIAPNTPYSFTSQLFFLQASYYACYLITFCVVLGDYIRSFQGNKVSISWIFSLLLCFATGMQSLRQTVIMVLPILVCELFLAFRRLIYRQKPWSEGNYSSLIHAFSYGIANILGLITINLLNIPNTSIYGNTQLTPITQILKKIPPILECLFEITGLNFGFAQGAPLLLIFFSISLVLLFSISLVLWVVHIKAQETPLKLCWLVCLVGIIGVSLSTVFTNTNIRTIYLFLWYPLAALSAITILLKIPRKYKYTLALLLCVFSFGNLFYSYKYGAELALQNDSSLAGRAFRKARDYGYRSYAETLDNHENAKQMCQWAMDGGYEYLYGDWITVPHVAVHSDGKLEAGCWKEGEVFQILGYINLQNIYGTLENQNALYIFTPDDEKTGLLAALERGITLTKVAEFGEYIAYTSPIPLMQRGESTT
ncbi:MAG: hypothetical protein Q4F17_07785 [Eubacteriales bacterium]|nr:hypothetical protein [Eubacteriales bacterium]